jgi:hypothetical protein
LTHIFEGLAMDLQSSLLSDESIGSIATQLGIPTATARAGAQALLPAILGGFKRNAQQRPDGLGGLLEGLGQLGGGGLASEVIAPGSTDPAPGNQILGSIFGSKDVSRTVAANAGTQAGIDPGLLRRMLPLLAMLAGGHMASRATEGSEPDAVAPTEAASGGLGGLLGGLLGGQGGGAGGIGSMLDLDGDGNPLDDLLGMVRGSRPS